MHVHVYQYVKSSFSFLHQRWDQGLCAHNAFAVEVRSKLIIVKVSVVVHLWVPSPLGFLDRVSLCSP
jgi:hypothetical protein